MSINSLQPTGEVTGHEVVHYRSTRSLQGRVEVNEEHWRRNILPHLDLV